MRGCSVTQARNRYVWGPIPVKYAAACATAILIFEWEIGSAGFRPTGSRMRPRALPTCLFLFVIPPRDEKPTPPVATSILKRTHREFTIWILTVPTIHTA